MYRIIDTKTGETVKIADNFREAVQLAYVLNEKCAPGQTRYIIRGL